MHECVWFGNGSPTSAALCRARMTVSPAMPLIHLSIHPSIDPCDDDRGCFVNLRANDAFTPHDALAALGTPPALEGVAAVHFGYPHLMKHFQGRGLRDFIGGVHALVQQQGGKERAEQQQEAAGAGARRVVLVSMDLNGVTAENRDAAVLAEALQLVDVLHLNEVGDLFVALRVCVCVACVPWFMVGWLCLRVFCVASSCGQPVLPFSLATHSITTTNNERQDEARLLTGVELDKSGSFSLSSLKQAAESLLQRGVGVVAITLGEKGAFVKATSDRARLQQAEHLAWQAEKWAGAEIMMPPYPLQDGAEANTNGAGDAFVAGLVAAVLCRAQALSMRQATAFAMLTARCVRLRDWAGVWVLRWDGWMDGWTDVACSTQNKS